MSDFWNQRYSNAAYVYGTKPNEFYKTQLDELEPGKILFPAEGEGRNAVYAATKSWQVFAFDPSINGKQKALQLAKYNNVNLNYELSDYENISYPLNSFEAIVLIFAHMFPAKRKEYHHKLISFLKPGGKIILEGFSKNQINNNSGGPRDIEMLFSKEMLSDDFNELSSINITETETFLEEGLFHNGKASVIRLLGKK